MKILDGFRRRRAVKLARLRLERGDPKPEIRALALQWLEKDLGNDDLLKLIRDIDSLYSETAQYYRLLIRGRLSEGEGFYSNWHVIADSLEEALDFIKVIDSPPAPLSIDEWEILRSRTNDPKGVYWRSGRVYFEDED
ncbi:MAG TPA: hypothetical protein VG477_14320 [Thermoanaerobaculia bacterium]|nr:hypothetical protein [Thermoanaerobaculia bacterium]